MEYCDTDDENSFQRLPPELRLMIITHISSLLYPILRLVCRNWNDLILHHIYREASTAVRPTIKSSLCWFIENGYLFNEGTTSTTTANDRQQEKCIVQRFFEEMCPSVFSPSVSDYGLVRTWGTRQWMWLQKQVQVFKWTVHSLTHGWDSKECAIQRAMYDSLRDTTKRVPVVHVPEAALVAALNSQNERVIDAILFESAVAELVPLGNLSNVEEIFHRLTVIGHESRTNPSAEEAFERYLFHGPLFSIVAYQRQCITNAHHRHAPSSSDSVDSMRSFRNLVANENGASFATATSGTNYNMDLVRKLDERMIRLGKFLVLFGSTRTLEALLRFDRVIANSMRVSRTITAFYRPTHTGEIPIDLETSIRMRHCSQMNRSEVIYQLVNLSMYLARFNMNTWLRTEIAGDTAGPCESEPESHPQTDRSIPIGIAFANIMQCRRDLDTDLGLDSTYDDDDDDDDDDISLANFLKEYLPSRSGRGERRVCEPGDFRAAYCIAGSALLRGNDKGRGGSAYTIFRPLSDRGYRYVEWLYKNGAPIDTNCAEIASIVGNTKLLRYFKSKKPLLQVNNRCSYAAAFFGHYETFLWLVRHQCPWDEIRIASAVSRNSPPFRSALPYHRNRAKILRWVHENGRYGPGVEHMYCKSSDRVGERLHPLQCPPQCRDCSTSQEQDQRW
jgi:hypothetical protein